LVRKFTRPHKAVTVPPINTSDERQLIQQAQAGHEAATTTLYQRHHPAIYRYFYFRMGNPVVAEDLTAEVFLEMVRALPRYQDYGVPFAAWLFRIAHDRMVDHLRRAARRPTTELSEDWVDEKPGPEAEARTRALTDELRAALGALTDEQQRVVQLRFIEGYTLEETARLMQKNIGAIKAMQHRALNTLAQKLKKDRL